MSKTSLISAPAEGHKTLLRFWQRMAEELDGPSHRLLNTLTRALAERGWIPTVSEVVAKLVDEGEDAERLVAALANLVRRRLVALDPDHKRVLSLFGTLSTRRTVHRGHLESGVDLYTFGGMELLSLSALVARAVDGFTHCGHCERAIAFHVRDAAVERIEPTGAAGFQADWDGEQPLREVARLSPLFCSDACLEAWSEEPGDLEGLPMPGILLLHVGMTMAYESGQARYRMIGVG